MITTVKHLIEELQRFNPEARLEPHVEVGGPSYATQCNFTMDDTEEVKILESRIDELYDFIKQMKLTKELAIFDSFTSK